MTPEDRLDELEELLEEHLEEDFEDCTRQRANGELTLTVPRAQLLDVMKLLRGEIDLLQNDLPPEMFRFLDGRDEARVARRSGSNFTYLGLNLEDPALRRLEVRQAVACAIDRRAIIRHLMGGAADPALALFRPGHWAGAEESPSEVVPVPVLSSAA